MQQILMGSILLGTLFLTQVDQIKLVIQQNLLILDSATKWHTYRMSGIKLMMRLFGQLLETRLYLMQRNMQLMLKIN
ncbi:hypothetical protein HMPREF1214_00783 [Bacteroides sp. HPS0048]|nr:hypothetical protein HMPREF1214_00783 [Bacteroides sp. HPS0048]